MPSRVGVSDSTAWFSGLGIVVSRKYDFKASEGRCFKSFSLFFAKRWIGSVYGLNRSGDEDLN